jgi:CRP/FNR family transcriptional regulator, anaerobic regulatory protein
MNTALKTSCEKCKKCPIGIYASAKWKAEITRRKYQNRYPKGRYIFYQGNPVHGMFLIAEGKVKIVTQVSDDRNQIVRLTNEGHILGRQGKKKDTYANSAVAMVASQVCFIDNADVEELLLNNPQLAMHMMSYYSGELRKAEKRIKILAQLTAREKVAETLLYIETVFQSDKDGLIDTPLSRQDIAEICGASTTQVIREISFLKKEKIIETSNKHIRILDHHKLSLIGAQHT